MEIKSRMNSSIQPKVATENTVTKSLTSDIQTGLANIKDSFESVKASSAQLETQGQNSTKLDFVKNQMANFMASDDVNGSIFAVMMEYQKLVNKEAREDHKVARDSNNLELSAKQANLLSDDKEIGSAKGSHDMYQVVDSEAALEFFIGESSRLVKGDTKNDIDAMSNRLDELKKSAADVKEEMLQKTTDKDHVNKRYDMLMSWFSSRKDDD